VEQDRTVTTTETLRYVVAAADRLFQVIDTQTGTAVMFNTTHLVDRVPERRTAEAYAALLNRTMPPSPVAARLNEPSLCDEPDKQTSRKQHR
jgi:hypothetical protein